MPNNITPEEKARMEETQRHVAAYAERDPELVAVAAMAFADGLAVGTARAKQEKED